MTTYRFDGNKIWGYVLLVLSLVVLCYWLSGCVTLKRCNEKFPPQITTKDTISHTEIITRHDTMLLTLPDSAGWTAYFECRKNAIGNYVPFITNQHTTSGKNIHVNTSQSGTQTGLNVNVECKSDSLKNVITLLEKTIKDYRAREKTTIQKVNYVTGWQWFQIWSGRIFLGLLLIALIVVAVKFGLKKFL